MNDPFDFDGAVVLVTGGTRGIGRAIVAAFATKGARVVTCARSEPLEPLGDGVTVLTGDLRDPEQAVRFVEVCKDRFGRLDVVVNNAGGSPPAESSTASVHFSEAIVRLNLLAPLVVSQAANALMQDQETGGCIVNVASVSGLRPSPSTAAYGAAKAGLINLSETLAVEWAPRVRVNCVTPGLIATERAPLFYGEGPALARVAATVPLGRLGSPSDVAGACVFLASPLASYISGANLVVHGGGEAPAYRAAARPDR